MELFTKIFFLSIGFSLLMYFVYKSRYLIKYLFGFNKKIGEVTEILKCKNASEVYFEYKIKSKEDKIIITKNHFLIPKLKIGVKCIFINSNDYAIIIDLSIYQLISATIILFIFIFSIIIQLWCVIYLQCANNSLMLILTTVGLSVVIAYYFINKYKQRKHLLSNGKKTEGRVINIETLLDTDGINCFAPIVEFTNHDDISIKFTSMSKTCNSNDILVGKKVSIYYDNNFNEFAETEDYLNKIIF